MSINDDDYVLGKDVTAHARPKGQSGSSVFSIRLSLEELAELDAVSRSAGKTPSQIVREALKRYIHAEQYTQPSITVSIEGGMTVSTGASAQSTRPVETITVGKPS